MDQGTRPTLRRRRRGKSIGRTLGIEGYGPL